MQTADFDYPLPPDRIAQQPVEPRDESRLLVYRRADGSVSHRVFREIGDFLDPGDLLVINRTRVIPARLFGVKADTGGKVEILLLNRREPQLWEAMVGGKGLHPGREIALPHPSGVSLRAVITADLGGPRRLVLFETPIQDELDQMGEMPLPPYIRTRLGDPERYQTVYAAEPGSAAAPTAGLHFTPHLLEALRARGVETAEVLLHVGLDTFAPVEEDDPRRHAIHTEWCRLPEATAAAIRRARESGRKVVCVGTTSVRTVETAARLAQAGEIVAPYEGPTDLYILPGFEFKAVDAMVTNFHLPRSTLVMMVSALVGREKLLSLYALAVESGYRFYSFGDAMLIL